MTEIALICLICYFLADELVFCALCSGAVRCLHGSTLSTVPWLIPCRKTSAFRRRVRFDYLLTLEVKQIHRQTGQAS